MLVLVYGETVVQQNLFHPMRLALSMARFLGQMLAMME